MTACAMDADDHGGSLHSFAVEALKASRPRGRAQKGAPYAGLLLDFLIEDYRLGRSTYELARRGVRASMRERRQSPLLRQLHQMALQRIEQLQVMEAQSGVPTDAPARQAACASTQSRTCF